MGEESGMALPRDGGATVETIAAFFARVPGVSVQLPTRWYGRPRDNLHRLTALEHEGDRLVLHLDDRHVLSFPGGASVEDEGDVLTFSAFPTATWRAVGWGSAGVRSDEVFEHGVIRLWAPASGDGVAVLGPGSTGGAGSTGS